MVAVPPHLSFPQTIASGWVQRRQLFAIDFLQAENGMFKARLPGRFRFTNAERPLLARQVDVVGISAAPHLSAAPSVEGTSP